MDATNTHPSRRWRQRAYVEQRGTTAHDPERFAALYANRRFPLASRYDAGWVMGNHMGPNCLWLAEDLIGRLDMRPGMRVLDIGCGTAMTSIFLAREFGAEVWATDLWVSPHQNLLRAREAGVSRQVFALHAEARALPFQSDFFDLVFSVSAFNMWGGEAGYADYIARFLKHGGALAVVLPATPDETPVYDEGGQEIPTFHSVAWWRTLWEQSEELEAVHGEMVSDGRELWQTWVEADRAWCGENANQIEAPVLERNPSLGLCRVTARRR